MDITAKIEEAVRKSGVTEGICLVFTPHTTTAVMVNENEPNLKKDFVAFFKKFVPPGDYAHNEIDDNAEAHLKSACVGQDCSIPIVKGELTLGTWQQVFLCEFDGPRRRSVYVVCK